MELQGSEFLIDTHNAHTGNVIMHALCIVVDMIPYVYVCLYMYIMMDKSCYIMKPVDFFPPPSLV